MGEIERTGRHEPPAISIAVDANGYAHDAHTTPRVSHQGLPNWNTTLSKAGTEQPLSSRFGTTREPLMRFWVSSCRGSGVARWWGSAELTYLLLARSSLGPVLP